MEGPEKPTAPRKRALWAALPAAALALVAVWEIASVARGAANVATADDWRAASAVLRTRHQAGDLIVFAPRWVDPVGRQHLGDLISVDMAARMDGARYGTIWELSMRGARAPETRGLAAESTRIFGALTMRRFQRAPAVVLTDFVKALPRAKKSGPAMRPAQAVLEEVGFEPHRCVRVVPRPDKTVRITYAGVQLGTSLVGYVGLADVFTRRTIRDPGRLEVFVAGEPVSAVTFGVDDGWVRFEAATRPGAGQTVEFRATAVGPKARDRLICFAAEARR